MVKVWYYAVKTKWKRKAVRERLIYGDELENASVANIGFWT